MAKTIQIELTDIQFKGLEYAALSPSDWVENAVTDRARIANDEIVSIRQKNDNLQNMLADVSSKLTKQQIDFAASKKQSELF